MTKGGSGGQTDGLGATAAALTVRREGFKKKNEQDGGRPERQRRDTRAGGLTGRQRGCQGRDFRRQVEIQIQADRWANEQVVTGQYIAAAGPDTSPASQQATGSDDARLINTASVWATHSTASST